FRVRRLGGPSGNSALWMSSNVYLPDRRTTIRPLSSSHSITEPGPTPRRFRTAAGTEIWPCAVSFDLASAILGYYHGNENSPARRYAADRQYATRRNGLPFEVRYAEKPRRSNVRMSYTPRSPPSSTSVASAKSIGVSAYVFINRTAATM